MKNQKRPACLQPGATAVLAAALVWPQLATPHHSFSALQTPEGEDAVYAFDGTGRAFRILNPHGALIIDVIEHMTIAEGQALLNQILRRGCKVLLSTPKIWEEQHDPNNPYETHVSLWTWEDLPPAALDVSTIDSLIFLMEVPRG